MAHTQADFVMEVTDKTRADVQGGTLVNYDGHIRLLELAQVPRDHTDDFKSARNFALFNTNNLWINLRGIRCALPCALRADDVAALKRIMDSGGMALDLIVREKLTDDGQTVCQVRLPLPSPSPFGAHLK